jgi:hypothetical protein
MVKIPPPYTNRWEIVTYYFKAVHKRQISEHPYPLNLEQSNPEFLEALVEFIHSKGIDNNFAKDLAESATAIENNLKVESLHNLSHFLQ